MGFFEGLSKKVSETTSSIQETTNKIQRESKCKKTISDNNAKVEKIYSEIGKRVYENRKIDDALITFIEEKTNEIDTMLKENEELKLEILKLNNKKLCPNCKAEVSIGTSFCPQCGAEQEKVEVEAFIPKGKRKCSGCGEIIDDKNVFCPNCGAKKEEEQAGLENVEVVQTPEDEEVKLGEIEKTEEVKSEETEE